MKAFSVVVLHVVDDVVVAIVTVVDVLFILALIIFISSNLSCFIQLEVLTVLYFTNVNCSLHKNK